MRHNRMTRAGLEAKLGGNFQGVAGPNDPLRENGRWRTWILIHPTGRRVKAASGGGRKVIGKTWDDLAKLLGVAN